MAVPEHPIHLPKLGAASRITSELLLRAVPHCGDPRTGFQKSNVVEQRPERLVGGASESERTTGVAERQFHERLSGDCRLARSTIAMIRVSL
jgi:hypothetical protein